MRFVLGRQIEGPRSWRPKAFLFAGCFFLNWGPRSLMLVLPEWVVGELAIWGVDAIGD